MRHDEHRDVLRSVPVSVTPSICGTLAASALAVAAPTLALAAAASAALVSTAIWATFAASTIALSAPTLALAAAAIPAATIAMLLTSPSLVILDLSNNSLNEVKQYAHCRRK